MDKHQHTMVTEPLLKPPLTPFEACKVFGEIGASLVRLQPRTKEPIKDEKGHLGKEPPARPYADFLRLYQPGQNIGIRMGLHSKTPFGYLHALDVDTRNPETAQEARSIAENMLPEESRAFVVKTGSGTGEHWFFFSPVPLDPYAVKGDGFEVALKGTGTYVVGPGSIHPDTGAGYELVKGADFCPKLAELIPPPVADMSRLRPPPCDRKPRDPLDELIGKSATFDAGQLQRLLDRIPVEITGRDAWVRSLMAVHFESDGADWGLDMVDAWSAGDTRKTDAGKPMYPGRRKLERQWNGFRGGMNPITGRFLEQLAQEVFRATISPDDFPDLPELGSLEHVLSGLLGTEGVQSAPQPEVDLLAPQPSKLRFIKPDQCATAPKRGYIVKGLLAPRDVAAIVGQPGCGKSTLAPLLGYMVAQGKEAFGQRTRQGGVFYVAAEDETGLQMRVAALRQEHGEAPDFTIIAGVANLRDRESPDLAALAAAVKDQRPSVIFIDTLAQAFPALEENDAAAMGRVVAVARSLTEWGAAVVLIHHDTKAGDGLPRGHSILNGALDVSLALKKKEKSVTGNLSKNRNGPCDLEIRFDIESAELDEDEDGELVTAAICRPILDDFSDIGPRNASERIFMQTLFSVLERDGGTEVDEKTLRIELAQSSSLSRSESADTQRKAYRRVRDALAGHGVLSRSQGYETLKPLISFDMCFPNEATGHAGQGGTNGKYTVRTEAGQTGQTP